MLKICSVVLLFGQKPTCSSDSSSSLNRSSMILSNFCWDGRVPFLWYRYYERFRLFWPSLGFPYLLAYDHKCVYHCLPTMFDKFSWYVDNNDAGGFLCLQHSDCLFYFCLENGRISIFILRQCSKDVVTMTTSMTMFS